MAVGYRRQRRRQIAPLQNLSGIDMIGCLNKHKVHTAPAHLLGKVNVNSWLTSTDEKFTLDRLYIIARLCATKIFEVDTKPLTPKDQNIPSLNGFYAILQYKFDQYLPKTTVGYNLIIRGIATEKNTIYTGLKLIKRQMGTAGELPPVTTLDLQLYIIPQEIRFANWEEPGQHMLRLDGFHVHEQVWKIFGKKYAASGLEDIHAEANVFDANAASVIMSGSTFKRCTLARSLVNEAICRLEWNAFLAWIVEKEFLGRDDASELEEKCMQEVMKDFLKTKKKVWINQEQLKVLQKN